MAIKVVLILVFAAIIIGGIALGIVGGVNLYSIYDYGYSDKVEESKQKKNRATRKIIIGVILALTGIITEILVPGNIHQVNTGEVAVVRHMGTVTGIRNPGVYWDWYFTNDYEIYNTKIISANFTKEETASYSKDNQVIMFDLNIQYRIPNNEVKYVAENIGSTNALEDVIAPKMLDATKNVIGTRGAEEIIQLRETVATVIKEALSTPFITDDGAQFITITSVNIKNIEFTPDFEAAVAAKVAEEQKRQQAEIEQARQLAEAENNKQIAIKNAEASAESARLAAEAEAEVAKIKAQAEQEVAKIAADTAEYAGRKDAAVSMNKLAGINGWYVINVTDTDGNVIGYKLMKSDGTLVTESELETGVKNLLEVYKYDKWDGSLPQYQMGSNGTIAVVTP